MPPPSQVRSSLFLLYCSLLTCWLLLATTAFATPQHTLLPLTSTTSLERRLVGGETHAYQVPLAAGQYVCVAIHQQAIDVELRFVNSTGQRLVEMDSLNFTQGIEVAALLADQSITRKNLSVYASNDPEFRSGVVRLATRAATAVAYGATWSTAVSDTRSYRYVRFMKNALDYDTAGSAYWNVSEIRVFGSQK